MKKIFLILSIVTSFAIHAEAKNGGTTDGAFTTLMLSATDIGSICRGLKIKYFGIQSHWCNRCRCLYNSIR